MASTLPSTDFQEELKCPVCFKIPRTTPIYQCTEGHIHCKECHPWLNRCPVCRSPTLYIRALMIEKLIADIPINCAFHDLGCQEAEKRLHEMKIHEAECNFRQIDCLFKWCDSRTSVMNIIQHFRSAHRSHISSYNFDNKEVSLYTNFEDLRPYTFCLHFLNFENHDFLIQRELNSEELFTINIFLIGAEKDRKKYTCKIKASNSSVSNVEIVTTGFANVIGSGKVTPNIVLHPQQIRDMRDAKYWIEFKVTITSNVCVPKVLSRNEPDAFIDNCQNGSFCNLM